MVLSYQWYEQPLMKKLKQTFAFLKGSLRASYSPSDLLELFPRKFKTGRQQDCHEFLKYLLDTLQEQEKSSATSSPENFESVVQKVFGGELETTYKCLNCNSVSLNTECFTNLLLAIPEQKDTKNNSETTTIGKKHAFKK